MTSVRMKTMGQISTPAVKLREPVCPNRFQPLSRSCPSRDWTSACE
jgi:hypothetical protein